MLVLTRQPGECLVIADSIVVTVVGVAKGKVRLGIEAPNEIPVLRQELLARAAAGSVKPAQVGPKRQK